MVLFMAVAGATTGAVEAGAWDDAGGDGPNPIMVMFLRFWAALGALAGAGAPA
jgi:hypothetical protein